MDDEVEVEAEAEAAEGRRQPPSLEFCFSDADDGEEQGHGSLFSPALSPVLPVNESTPRSRLDESFVCELDRADNIGGGVNGASLLSDSEGGSSRRQSAGAGGDAEERLDSPHSYQHGVLFGAAVSASAIHHATSKVEYNGADEHDEDGDDVDDDDDVATNGVGSSGSASKVYGRPSRISYGGGGGHVVSTPQKREPDSTRRKSLVGSSGGRMQLHGSSIPPPSPVTSLLTSQSEPLPPELCAARSPITAERSPAGVSPFGSVSSLALSPARSTSSACIRESFIKVVVAVRVRPMLASRQETADRQTVVDAREGHVVVVNPSKFQASPDDVLSAAAALTRANIATFDWARLFHFDATFWSPPTSAQDRLCASQSYSSQADVFDISVRRLAEGFLQGRSSVCLSFGRAGSGKTYSMFGAHPTAVEAVGGENGAGLAQRACHVISAGMNMEASSLTLTYIQLGEDGIQNLLDPSSQPEKHRIRERPQTGAYVDFVTPVVVKDALHLAELLSTGCVSGASRAIDTHSLVTLEHLQLDPSSGMEEVRAKLHLVDLASSSSRSGGGSHAAYANKSLAALGTVLQGLASAPAAVHDERFGGLPWRDSSLTWLLRGTLSAAGTQVSLLAHVNPCSSAYHDTMATLSYAERIRAARYRRRAGSISGASRSLNTSITEADALVTPGVAEKLHAEEVRELVQGLAKEGNDAARAVLYQTVADPQQRIAKLLGSMVGAADHGGGISPIKSQQYVADRIQEVEQSLKELQQELHEDVRPPNTEVQEQSQPGPDANIGPGHASSPQQPVMRRGDNLNSMDRRTYSTGAPSYLGEGAPPPVAISSPAASLQIQVGDDTWYEGVNARNEDSVAPPSSASSEGISLCSDVREDDEVSALRARIAELELSLSESLMAREESDREARAAREELCLGKREFMEGQASAHNKMDQERLSMKQERIQLQSVILEVQGEYERLESESSAAADAMSKREAVLLEELEDAEQEAVKAHSERERVVSQIARIESLQVEADQIACNLRHDLLKARESYEQQIRKAQSELQALAESEAKERESALKALSETNALRMALAEARQREEAKDREVELLQRQLGELKKSASSPTGAHLPPGAGPSDPDEARVSAAQTAAVDSILHVEGEFLRQEGGKMRSLVQMLAQTKETILGYKRALQAEEAAHNVTRQALLRSQDRAQVEADECCRLRAASAVTSQPGVLSPGSALGPGSNWGDSAERGTLLAELNRLAADLEREKEGRREDAEVAAERAAEAERAAARDLEAAYSSVKNHAAAIRVQSEELWAARKASDRARETAERNAERLAEELREVKKSSSREQAALWLAVNRMEVFDKAKDAALQELQADRDKSVSQLRGEIAVLRKGHVHLERELAEIDDALVRALEEEGVPLESLNLSLQSIVPRVNGIRSPAGQQPPASGRLSAMTSSAAASPRQEIHERSIGAQQRSHVWSDVVERQIEELDALIHRQQPPTGEKRRKLRRSSADSGSKTASAVKHRPKPFVVSAVPARSVTAAPASSQRRNRRSRGRGDGGHDEW